LTFGRSLKVANFRSLKKIETQKNNKKNQLNHIGLQCVLSSQKMTSI